MAIIQEFQEPPINNNVVTEGEGVLDTAWEEWIFDLTAVQTQIFLVNAIMDPTSIPSNFSTTLTFTITQIVDVDGNTVTIGADDILFEEGDLVLQLIKPALTAGIIIGSSRITGTNIIDVDVTNVTGGNINPASETYIIVILKGQ